MHLDNVGAVILAGGRATRMGGEDKGLVCLKGKPLVSWAAEKLMPVCAHVVVSANRNLAAYRALGLTVVTDSEADFPGPLAGWLAAMDVLTTDFVVSIPCDVPFFPEDMVEKLYAALIAAPDKACAAVRAGGFPQPTAAIMRRTARCSLAQYLAKGEHRVRGWLESAGCVWVDFGNLDAFANINTPEELAAAQQRLVCEVRQKYNTWERGRKAEIRVLKFFASAP